MAEDGGPNMTAEVVAQVPGYPDLAEVRNIKDHAHGLAFGELQRRANDPDLTDNIKKFYQRERQERANDITNQDPGFSGWLRDQIDDRLDAGWNRGPETLFADSREIEARAGDRLYALGGGRVNLQDERYAGIVRSSVVTASEIARLTREIRNEQDPQRRAQLESQRVNLEQNGMGTFLGVSITESEVSRQMSSKKTKETANKLEKEKQEQQKEADRKKQEAEEARLKKEKEDSEKKNQERLKKEEELRNMDYQILTREAFNGNLDPAETQRYRTELIRRTGRFLRRDTTYIDWLRGQVIQLVTNNGREETPNTLALAGEQIARMAQSEHPDAGDHSIRGIETVVVGSLAREARLINALRNPNLQPAQRQRLELQLQQVRDQRVVDLEVNIDALMNKGEASKRQKDQEEQRKKQEQQPQQRPQAPDKSQGLQEKKDEFPQEYEKQYEFVMQMVGKIEASNRPIVKHSSNEAVTVDPKDLQVLIDTIRKVECNPKIRDEAMARLRIYDSKYVLENAAKLSGQDTINYLRSAYSDLNRTEYAFQPADASILAESDFLQVNDAYLLYINGRRNGIKLRDGTRVDIRRKDLPDELRNKAMFELCERLYSYEYNKAEALKRNISDLSRQRSPDLQIAQDELQKVNGWLVKASQEITQIRDQYDQGSFVVAPTSVLGKSIELADRVCEVWAEKSVVDNTPTGVGKELLWSVMHFDKWRAVPGNDPGPSVTLPYIPDLGVESFARRAEQRFDRDGNVMQSAQYCFAPEMDPKMYANNPTSSKADIDAVRAFRVRGVDPTTGEFVPVTLTNVNWRRTPQNAWLEYIQKTVPAALELRDILCKSTWASKDVGPDRIDDLRTKISRTSGVYDPYHIGAWWALGVFTDSVNSSDPSVDWRDLGWDGHARTQFARTMISRGLLSNEDYSWVLKNETANVPQNVKGTPGFKK